MICEPTPELVAQRVQEYDADPTYAVADRVVQRVFDRWPTNTCIEDVLEKVVVLDALYSTQIYGRHKAAQHIVNLDIDQRLKCGDISLVNDVADMKFSDKQRFNQSFASKYCSWQQPEHFQMYDSYVVNLLWAYKSQFSIGSHLKKKNLQEFSCFLQVVEQFRERFGLVGISRRNLDKFLWLEGRKLAQLQQPNV